MNRISYGSLFKKIIGFYLLENLEESPLSDIYQHVVETKL